MVKYCPFKRSDGRPESTRCTSDCALYRSRTRMMPGGSEYVDRGCAISIAASALRNLEERGGR